MMRAWQWFLIFAIFVNIISAVLSTIGIIYYVFFYTLHLKRTTIHNIIIGGAAGAIPPLVGWTAVTNSLSLGALYLFAIIFFWTPPHTWALAMMVKKDYARAGVPMLPVVAGEKETSSTASQEEVEPKPETANKENLNGIPDKDYYSDSDETLDLDFTLDDDDLFVS